MSRAARLFLVAVMLLAQFALGEEVRFCAPATNSKAAAPKKCESLCCCPKDGRNAPKGQRCEIKKAQRQVVDGYLAPSPVQVPAILPPVETVPVFSEPIESRPVPPHLVVPRTRAPDIDEHPLRAPPAR